MGWLIERATIVRLPLVPDCFANMSTRSLHPKADFVCLKDSVFTYIASGCESSKLENSVTRSLSRTRRGRSVWHDQRPLKWAVRIQLLQLAAGNSPIQPGASGGGGFGSKKIQAGAHLTQLISA